MKPHYFEQQEADTDDMLLGMAKMQGYVPQTCLLGGATVMGEVRAIRSPCDGCHGPREKCKGKPYNVPALFAVPTSRPTEPDTKRLGQARCHNMSAAGASKKYIGWEFNLIQREV